MPTKTVKKFKNAFDYVPPKGEVNSLEQITQPDMTLSLKELLKRFVRGGEVSTFTPNYQEHDDFDDNPDIMKMDAVERLEYARQIRESIPEKQAEITRKLAEAEAAEKQEKEASARSEVEKGKNPAEGKTADSAPPQQ